MKRLIFLSLFVFLCAATDFAQKKCEINVVPQPLSVECLGGDFKLNFKTKIFAADNPTLESAGTLNDLLMKNYGFKLEVVSAEPKNNYIKLRSLMPDPGFPQESYFLSITKDGVSISGMEKGRFYAIQTLLQLLPAEFKGEAKLQTLRIEDKPRFAYRGMHLDVSRHFMPVSFVKKYLDLMSQYKFNQFHWHLTDDQGWRIEIKKYPRLTEIASKRPQSHEGKYSPVFKGDGRPVEGFYTQEEIKDVVAYAKARKINVIPEIELPGHASAALTAYPELGKGCKDNYEYKVQMTWGIFKEVFCPTDATFQFLEDVLSETIALFPDSPYVHIGGDEVLKDFWKDSAFVQELKRKENLKDEHEVQSYFVRRIEKFVNSKGKKIIGWDEILEGGVAPNATIMSWRGEKGGIESAKAKHDVIMTPNTYLYLDYGQGDPKYEPLNIGSFIPLEKVYSYNPIPKELSPDEAKYILGAQANIWTEYLEKPEAVEYMAFPRMIALSEVNWSPLESKNYADFTRRMFHQYQMLDKEKVHYRIPTPEGLQNILLEDTDTAKIELKPQISNAKIFYTLDGSEPTTQSKRYEKPLELKLKQDETVEVKTIVVNEKDRKSSVYTATVMRRNKLKAVNFEEKEKGVKCIFFDNSYGSVRNLEGDPNNSASAQSSNCGSILLTRFAGQTNNLKDAFGVKYGGYIYAPEDAIYEFELESKDGSLLTIGNKELIDLDSKHPQMKKTALVPLAKGYHKFDLSYVQSGGDPAFLSVRWGIKGQGLSRIYGSELFAGPTVYRSVPRID